MISLIEASQSMSPDVRSRQIRRHRVSPSVTVVRNTRSFQMIGDDQPSPGIGVFHFTFDRAVHSTGTFFSAEIPWPVGPRKPGQFSAGTPTAAVARRVRMEIRFTLLVCQTVAQRASAESIGCGLAGSLDHPS